MLIYIKQGILQMKIYVGVESKRKEKIEAGYINFADFEEMVKNSSAAHPNSGWLNIQDISGWYKNEIDETLVGYVATGNSEKLREYIDQNTQGAEYLRELRFDGDGIATKMYNDCSGWSLLNVAAAAGKPEMVDFLVQEVGMDINTICYGVSPTYCCFPSMHDDHIHNFSSERLEAARAFIDNGADLSHQITDGSKPSGLNVLHIACHIGDSHLRTEALLLLTDKMTDCTIVDSWGKNALHHLFIKFGDNFSEITPIVEVLIGKGVSHTQRTKNGATPADLLKTHASKELFQDMVRKNAVSTGRG